LLFVLALVWCTESTAQSLSVKSDALVWTYDRFFNGRTQETLFTTGKLVTYPTTKVTWEQNNDNFIEEYSVTGVQNNWTDASAKGDVRFDVSWNGNQGFVKFYKTSEGLSAELRIQIAGKPDALFRFYFVNVQKL
jgi:hypothetical protein